MKMQSTNREALMMVAMAVALCVLSLVVSSVIATAFAGATEARIVAWIVVTACWMAVAYRIVSRSTSRRVQ